MFSWQQLQTCRQHFASPMKVHAALSGAGKPPLELHFAGEERGGLAFRTERRVLEVLEFLFEHPETLPGARAESRTVLSLEWKGARLGVRTESDDLAELRQVWLDDLFRLGETPLQGTVVDLGARTGLFAIRAALLGAQRVVACEPLEEDRQQLMLNLVHAGVGGKVKVREETLGLESGKGTCLIYGDDQAESAAARASGTFAAATTINLQDLFEQEEVATCDLLKARLDVPAHVQALVDADPLLLRRVKRLSLAIKPQRESQAALPALRQKLRQAGFNKPDEHEAHGLLLVLCDRTPRGTSGRLARPTSATGKVERPSARVAVPPSGKDSAKLPRQS